MWTIIEKIFRRYDAKGEVKLDRILNNSILRKCSLLLCSFYFVLFIGGCKPDKNDVTQEKNQNIVFSVATVNAKPCDKNVAVTVSVKNNPGFASATLEVHYDDNFLTLTGFSYKMSAMQGASSTPFREKASPPCLSVTNRKENITGDFDFATLFFDVAEDAEGSYDISLNCDENDVFDLNENNLNCTLNKGAVLITTEGETVSSVATKSFHTVLFKDEEGNEIATQTVGDGDASAAPVAPSKDGYVFKGWSEAVDEVTKDITVTPVYEPIGDSPMFEVEQVDANAGDKDVAVEISVKNNPGVASIAFDVIYDTDHLKMTDFQYNPTAISGSATVPFHDDVLPPHLSMVNINTNQTGDWAFATLYFEVASDAKGGYPIVLTYDEDNVYNIEETSIPFKVVNGIITVN